MLKKIMMAGLAVSALTINAPAASADHHQFNCRFNALTQATATGQDTWEGVAQGYVIGNSGEAVSIRCVVKVNGVQRAATDWGSGTTYATTQGRVTYTRTLTEVTQLCAEWTLSGTPGSHCFSTTTTQIPPQEVYDLVIDPVFDILIALEEQLWTQYLDPLYQNHVRPIERLIDQQLCDELAAANGTYGPIEIKEGTADPATGAKGGDVYVDGELFWDCPGYEPTPA